MKKSRLSVVFHYTNDYVIEYWYDFPSLFWVFQLYNSFSNRLRVLFADSTRWVIFQSVFVLFTAVSRRSLRGTIFPFPGMHILNLNLVNIKYNKRSFFDVFDTASYEHFLVVINFKKCFPLLKIFFFFGLVFSVVKYFEFLFIESSTGKARRY